MLNRILFSSLNNRIVVLLAAVAVCALGLWKAARMPIDVLPDLNRPVVTVMTEAHGMVPEDVERLVTWPIEQVMNGATGVFRVRSSSGPGLSVVYVEFEWDTDIYRDRQVVAEKLQLAQANLPPEVQPVMAPISSIMGQVQIVGFTSKSGEIDALEMRRLIDRDVKPRMLSLSGVAQIVTIGGQPTELQVVVDADRLRAHDVTLSEVADAVRGANVNVSGGTVELGPKGPTVAVSGLLEDPAQLGRAVVRREAHRPILVSDVADVVFGPAAVRVGDAGIDGGPGVQMVVMKQPGADTLDLTERVNAELAAIARELPDDVLVRPELFQQAAFIERAVDNVLEAVRDGGILVILILFVFLLNLRTTVITLTAIPLSVAVTALVFDALGLSINTMTLGGLAVAIGTLVDDAIVDVENVYRRLHENANAARPDPALVVVFRASREIRKPVLYGTLLVTVVYLPLFFLSGIEGRLFAPIGLAFLISVFASLIVAMTVTPVLCYYLLGGAKRSSKEYGGPVVRVLWRAAERVVRFSIRNAEAVLGVAVAALIVVGVWSATLGRTFLPAFDEGAAQVNLLLPPDTGLATSDVYGRRLEEVVGSIDGVASIARRTGRASGDEHVMPVSVNEAIVQFDPDSTRPREEILEEIRDRLDAEFPGVATATEQPLAHLLSHLLSGVTAQVAIKISGTDLVVLRESAAEIEAAISGIDGVRDLYVEPQVLIDQVLVRPDRSVIAREGLDVEQVARTVELAMGAEEVSRFQVGRITYPIKVSLRGEDRRNLDAIGALYLRRSGGSLTRLEDVAQVALSKTPNNIQREDVQRRIVVQHNVAGRALNEVVADVERALEPVRERLAETPGYSIRVSGQFEAQQAATRTIALLGLASLVLMVAILYSHFRSLRIAVLVLATRPFALVGGAVLLAVTGQDLSVAALVGFIALLGIAARNAILLVDHALHLMREGDAEFDEALIVRAGKERIVPVLMTALTSGIGLLPLAMSAGEPGREILYPVATVILGGLFTNTLLDFLVVPGLLHRVAGPEARRLADLPDADDDDAALEARLSRGAPAAAPGDGPSDAPTPSSVGAR